MARFSCSSAMRHLYYRFCSSSVSAPSSSFSTFHLRHFSSVEPCWKESVEQMRNIWISGLIDPANVPLTERLMFYSDRAGLLAIRKSMRSIASYEMFGENLNPRRFMLTVSATSCTFKDCRMNIFDTFGPIDFTVDVERNLRVVDGAILVLCSVSGVQSHSFKVDRQMRRCEVPRLVFINNLDHMKANPWKVLSQARSMLQHHSAVIQVPIGLGDGFKGLVDLVHLKAYSFHDSNGEEVVVEEVPVDMEALVSEKRRELIKAVSEVDDKLSKAFLADKPISAVDLEEAVRRATIARKFIPVFMGSAFVKGQLHFDPTSVLRLRYRRKAFDQKIKGIQQLLDGAVSYLPCPIEVSNYALDQTKNEKVVLDGTYEGPLVALTFKLVKNNKNVLDSLTSLRIYNGVVRVGDFITHVNTDKKMMVRRLSRIHSFELEGIQEAHVGEIVTAMLIDWESGDMFSDGESGDTFTDGSVRYAMPDFYKCP